MKNSSIIKLSKSIFTWIQNQIFFIIGSVLILYSMWGAFIFAIEELILGVLFILIGLYVRKVEREISEETK
jgi:hypothetical protein